MRTKRIPPPTAPLLKTTSTNLLTHVPDLSSIRRELYRRSLYEYVKAAWPRVQPKEKFTDNWHIRVICDHLQAISNHQFNYLIINIPPRHMKSLLVGVFWPTWEWGPANKPELKYLTASYEKNLSVRDATKARRLMESPWYQTLWPSVKFRENQDAKARYENTSGGHRICLSTDSGGTGEGGDRLIYDDPVSLKDARSDAARLGSLQFWKEVMGSRGDNPKQTARIVVTQRSHPEDLSQSLLDEGGYQHVCLPFEYDDVRRSTLLGYYDPRNVSGEYIWPERYDTQTAENLKRDVGSYGVSSQLQQAPTYKAVEEDNITRYFKRYATAPAPELVIQSLDTMYSPSNTSAYNVCMTAYVYSNSLYIVHVYRKKEDYYSLKQSIIQQKLLFKPDILLIERKSSGISLLQELPHMPEMNDVQLIGLEPIADKVVRFNVESQSIRAGQVYLPEGTPAWCSNYERELADFPEGATKDQADTTSQLIWYWRTYIRSETASRPSFSTGTILRTFGRASVVMRH